MGAYGTENNSLILTKFLMHYLKAAVQIKGGIGSRSDYGGLANTVVHGVKIQSLVGEIDGMLDEATLDDLLISGHGGGVYDVNLVLRLVRVFVSDDRMTVQRMKKVGRLIDKYMREISHDQNLKISKFLAIAESLPDSAKD
ncbi:hypothetical protein NE237_007378 [Protea cynaroides]|uniref:NPH3 domain-containing protein n=1 Tax=Protea cynaroides TaxID=273540 RepID=A0A9Q0QWF7_9MAGN|nr:hypothetical protein NE237_007378 [Protea cynaroides]